MNERDYYLDDPPCVEQFIDDAIDEDLFKAAEVHLKPNIRKKDYEYLVNEMKAAKELQVFTSNEPKSLVKKSCRMIFIGATGAGKSSIINFFYLWSKKVNRVEEITHTLIPTKYFQGIDGDDFEKSRVHD